MGAPNAEISMSLNLIDFLYIGENWASWNVNTIVGECYDDWSGVPPHFGYDPGITWFC